MITQPIKELLVGVKNIAAGNFKQRTCLRAVAANWESLPSVCNENGGSDWKAT